MSTQKEDSLQFGNPHFRNRLRALRHLPPGASFSRPTSSSEVQLLEELLLLPDTVDPVLWLIRERRTSIAFLALRYLISELRQATMAARRSAASGRSVVSELQTRVGPFIGLEGARDPFLGTTRNLSEDPHDVVRLTRRLQQVYTQNRDTRPGHVLAQPSQISVEVLQLRDDLDPINWLATEQGAWSASYVFARLLTACRPPGELSLAPMGRLLADQPELSWQDLRISVEGVDLLSEGFAVIVHTDFRSVDPDLGSEHGRQVGYWFDGFDAVVDDLGFEYLPVGMRGQWRDIRSPEVVYRSYYPSVALGAHELTLSCSPLRLRTRQIMGSGGEEEDNEEDGAQSYVSFGGAQWRIPVDKGSSRSIG